MIAKAGDKIKLKKFVCYGTAYGLVEVEEGTVLTVANRIKSRDGIETVEKIELKNEVGEVLLSISVWGGNYDVLTESKNLKNLKNLAEQFNDNGYIECIDFEDLEVMNWAVEQAKKAVQNEINHTF